METNSKQDIKKVRKSKKRKKQEEKLLPVKPIAVIFLVFVLFGVAVAVRTPDIKRATDTRTMLATRKSDIPRTLSELTLSIRKIINDENGVYSVRYIDLSSGDSFGINDHVIMTAASVNKIPILATLYKKAAEGTVDLDQEITISEDDMQNWGTGIIQYEKPGVKYTNRELAQILMENSDNTAAWVLTHKVLGQKDIQDQVNKWDLASTDMENNETSNKDMSKLMMNLYNNNYMSESLSREALEWMDDSQFEERLPKYLPESVPVFHKIGNEVRIIHDVGIVEIDGNSYYLGVMVSETGEMERSKEVIAEISRLVYDYQLNK